MPESCEEVVQAKVEYIKPLFQKLTYNGEIGETKILYQVLKMTDSVLLFINERSDLQLSSLHLGMLNRYDKTPNSTRIFGSFLHDDNAKMLSCRLSKKLNIPVFVSCNLSHEIPAQLLLKQVLDHVVK